MRTPARHLIVNGPIVLAAGALILATRGRFAEDTPS